MNSGGPAASELWLEIDITQVGTELAVAGRGGLQMESSEHPSFSMNVASQFGAWVKSAAESHLSLSLPALREDAPLSLARQLQEAIFRPGIREVLYKLQGAAQGRPLLLKINPRSSALKAIPWEALCLPGSASDFLGTSPEVLLARGVASTTAWQTREVHGAVRLLVISPEDPGAPGRLKSMLSESITSGELEWLEPLIGPKASKASVENRLRQEPVPHILHFIGHGGLEGGSASLQMAAGSEQGPGYPVRLLADELRNLFRDELRLIVLESCEGAQPGELLSAAEELVRGAAGAVIAHLWEVKADVARRCSAAFYRSLTGRSEHAGDVARSLHAARRTILNEFHQSAEAFSPVLYLRGRQPFLFDFSRRLVPPRAPSAQPHNGASARQSPFIVGLPITREHDLFGRKREQGEILEAVDKGLPVQLLGGAKIGKSSLLNWAARHLPGGRPVAHIEPGGTLSPVKLVSEIARKVGRPEIAERLTHQGANSHTAAEQLHALGQLVLLIDEADKLAMIGRDFDEGFFEMVRGRVESGALSWISASRIDLYDLFERRGLTSRFLNSSERIWVAALDGDAARRLAALGGPAHAERILYEAGGFAYGLQWLGDRLARATDDVAELCEQFRWEMAQRVFSSWWDGLLPEEQSVLKACARKEIAPGHAEEEVRRHLRNLRDRGLLTKSGEHYQLAPGEAWREFVRNVR